MVLARAGLAAVLASLACYPRMAAVGHPRAPISFEWPVLLLCQFVLWAFVFAWQFEYSHRPVFGGRFQPKIWALATLCGAVWAFLLHFQDPQYRLLAPADYPTGWNSWLAMTLFALALQPVFTYFAPFAFFIRLSRKASVANSPPRRLAMKRFRTIAVDSSLLPVVIRVEISDENQYRHHYHGPAFQEP